jgi:hypothetical protein
MAGRGPGRCRDRAHGVQAMIRRALHRSRP